jgi:hypothetical protein
MNRLENGHSLLKMICEVAARRLFDSCTEAWAFYCVSCSLSSLFSCGNIETEWTHHTTGNGAQEIHM